MSIPVDGHGLIWWCVGTHFSQTTSFQPVAIEVTAVTVVAYEVARFFFFGDHDEVKVR